MHQPIIPTVGRVVLYVLPEDSPRHGEIRPADVVRVNAPGNPSTTCNLRIKTDGPNDTGSRTLNGPNGIPVACPYVEPEWRGSVAYDDTKRPGTWHWMEHQLLTAKPAG